MKKIAYVIMLGLGLLLLPGCASGPGFAEVKATIPSLDAEKGRVFFYRATTFGAAITPSVNLDGTVVGTSKAEGFFYVDMAPGSHTVETSTEVTRRLSFTLEKGQTRYVKMSVSMGFFAGHVYPELVENSIGEKEITECKFTGTK